MSRRRQGRAGATDALPDTYGSTPDQLAELLNEWRRRAVS